MTANECSLCTDINQFLSTAKLPTGMRWFVLVVAACIFKAIIPEHIAVVVVTRTAINRWRVYLRVEV